MRLPRPLLALLAACAGCSSPQGLPLHTIAPRINETLRATDGVVAAGDLLRVRELAAAHPGQSGPATGRASQLDQDVRVQADGRASFAGLDDVHVAGLLPSDLDELLTAAYAQVLTGEPSLSVTIAEPAPRFVTVLGELHGNGVQLPLPPDGHLTLVEALGAAGGPSKRSAWLSNTLLVRWDAGEKRQRSWRIDARPKFWGEGEPVFLQPHDIVLVPHTNVDAIAIGVENFVRRMIPAPLLRVP